MTDKLSITAWMAGTGSAGILLYLCQQLQYQYACCKLLLNAMMDHFGNPRPYALPQHPSPTWCEYSFSKFHLLWHLPPGLCFIVIMVMSRNIHRDAKWNMWIRNNCYNYGSVAKAGPSSAVMTKASCSFWAGDCKSLKLIPVIKPFLSPFNDCEWRCAALMCGWEQDRELIKKTSIDFNGATTLLLCLQSWIVIVMLY